MLTKDTASLFRNLLLETWVRGVGSAKFFQKSFLSRSPTSPAEPWLNKINQECLRLEIRRSIERGYNILSAGGVIFYGA